IIYSKDINASDVENNLAIGQGKHLKFASGTYGLIPYIAVDKDDDQSISISQAVGWNQLNANIITDGDNGTFEAEKETYQLLNANIFTDATNGTFEDIEANWISPKDDGVHWVERSSTYAYAGSFSCRASGFFYESATVSVVDSFNKEFTALNLSFKPSLVSGRRYILKA